MSASAGGHGTRLRQRAVARVPVLLREPPFRRYWAAETISLFGDQVASVAMPLTAVLVFKAGAAEMGYLTALIWLPSLLFGLYAGAWVDRRGQRRATMIAADAGRFVLFASVPVCYAFGVLTLAQLYAVAFAAGVFSVFFSVSDTTLFVALVPPQRYVDGNSLIYASRALSFVGGPSVGGLLVQSLTAPFAIAANALSFLGSALFLRRIRTAEPPPAASGQGSLTAGARFIARTSIIRAELCAVATINFFNLGFLALLTLYAVRELHVIPGVLGLVLGAGAVGGVAGAAITKRLSSAVGAGWANVLGCVLFTTPLLLIPAAAGPKPLVLGTLFLAEFGSGFGVMVLDITFGSITATVIPDEVRARVTGAFQAVNYGTRPLGALAAGGLATLIGLRPTLWLTAGGATLGFLWLLPSPLPRFRMPSAGAATPASAPPG